MNIFQFFYDRKCAAVIFLMTLWLTTLPMNALATVNISQVPLLVTQSVPPLVMLNVSNDNQLFFQAFPDYADLTGDGAPNTTYTHSVDYYGYFDSYKCYTYSSGMFVPAAVTENKYCSGQWSGNFLNWLTMARIDIVRKILYGGYRSTDTGETILERTYLPNDAHSWVRYYDGSDIHQLTPFALPAATTTTSTSSIIIPTGDRNDSDHRRTFATSWNSNDQVQIGDQIIIRDQNEPTSRWMSGVVLSRSSGNVEIQITGSVGAGYTGTSWNLTNNSRHGISFCNTTVSSTTQSQNVTDPPLLRVAQGNYSLWTANERWQCRWSNEKSRTGHAAMCVGGPNDGNESKCTSNGGFLFSNGNVYSASSLFANSDNPVRNQVGLGSGDYTVRLRACVSGLIGREDCKQYPSGSNKPVGLLQKYGEEGSIHFGLLTGTYTKNLSGGTLRKNITSFADEVDENSGQFIIPTGNEPSIIRSLNALRIYGYNHSHGQYTGAGDNCNWNDNVIRKANRTDGSCVNWGNPQAEMFLESLRYFAGLEPTSAFEVTGQDRVSGLYNATWEDPLSNNNWCAVSSIINFNASVSSFDGNELGGFSDLPGGSSVDTWTNKVGTGEGLHGQSRFYGGGNALCTSKTVGSLSGIRGLCPEAPNQEGTFQIAGLAHYAYTESIRTDLKDGDGETADIHVKTYGVTLAPAVPRINIPTPGGTQTVVTILPACENTGDGGLRCSLSDFRIIEQDTVAGTGKFFIQWDVHEWGSDFDMDINGTLSYVITADTITVTTQTWAQSSGRSAGFGYVISGTTQDGYHAHSGINNYNYTDPTGVLGCSNCNVNAPPTSVSYELSGTLAQLLREPAFYAAKWGGFYKTGTAQFPADNASWDKTGDGLPDNYFFAIDPARLAEGLTKAFDAIAQAAGATTSAAISSSILSDDALVYAAGFDSTDWSGELNAYRLEADGSRGLIQWNAAQKLAANGSRKLFTTNKSTVTGTSTTGIALVYSNLNDAQKAAMNRSPYSVDEDSLGAYRISWLHGSDTAHSSFRQRNGKILGDIVNSNPQFVRKRYQGFSRLLGAPSYRNIKEVIYVGANDGMLHAFDAETGDELFAFMPGELLLPESGQTFAPLTRLMEDDYAENHRFYVDGTPVIEEVSLGGQWRRVLIGTLGAGGRSVFALDVSDPQNFGADKVLWEFSHADLGYGVTKPVIARMNDGTWVAMFGNGYNSTNHRAQLFIVKLSDGTLLKTIDTGIGSSSLPNGLAPPAWTDWPELKVEAQWVYAGDLLGNLWRFDVTHSNTNQWKAEKIFAAVNGNGQTQPITSSPLISAITEHDALMISFGTGSYFRVDDGQDMPDAPIQSLYGILDQPHTSQGQPNVVDRTDNLVQQEIIAQRQETFGDHTYTIRILSNHPVDLSADKGWYIDLDRDDGERVINGPTRRAERVRFSTLIPNPDADPCSPSAGGFFMDFNLRTGGRTEEPVFDPDGDGVFNDDDKTALDPSDPDSINVAPSGIGDLGTGETIVTARTGANDESFCDADVAERLIRGGGDAAGPMGRGSSVACRQSWQQLR